MRSRNKQFKGILIRWRSSRLILLLWIFLGLFIPQAMGEQASVQVLVLPFEVRAPESSTYLRSQIATVLADHLQRDGATIIRLKETDTAAVTNQPPDEATIRRLGDTYEVDQVLWGSFTLIGDSFSLDARMTSPSDATTSTFSTRGKGLENLLNVLKSLSGKIANKLFKHEIISDVRVKGNERIETDAILRVVKVKASSVYQRALLSKDLKAIYAMGWFDDVRVEAVVEDGQRAVTFHVKEKPVIRYIKTSGNYLFDDEKIKENLTINTGAILNSKKIRTNIEQIELLYKEKNYHDIQVDYKLKTLKKNQADIEFIIEEGDKLYVTDIDFEGNNAFTEKRLQKIINSSEKGFFSWITSSGDFDRTALDQDGALLRQYYHNKGYIQARVGDPDVDFQQDGIRITFKIDEGPQFKVGKVMIVGDLLDDLDTPALVKTLKISNTVYFSREKLREDVTKLQDLYGEKGFAYVDVSPMTNQNPGKLIVDVTFKITKGNEVYFDNITISGNTRTRDKVIRRQLRIYEQERFDGKALKRSYRNLHRIGYFEDIKVNTVKSSEKDKMDVNIEVTEQPTGMFSFGAGYSDEEKAFLTGEIKEDNLFGRGQTLQFRGTIGGTTSDYRLSFTEPWLFDTPLSTTLTVYDQTKEYDDYERHTIGGGISMGYRLFDYTRGYVSYAYDISDITIDTIEIDIAEDINDGVQDGFTKNVNDNILELEGENITSSVTVGLSYDSRNHNLNPTEGSRHSVSFEYAGLGGDIGFNKFRVETSWYYSLTKNLVFLAHAKYGRVTLNSSDKLLPDYEKFYLGGINSIRGFDWRGINITETNAAGEEVEAGGESMIQFNFELIFPISRNVGLMGVVFYDTGNVYESEIELDDLRKSFGGGIRWFSPMAPIRIEYGRVIEKRTGEKNGRWEFTMGGAF